MATYEYQASATSNGKVNQPLLHRQMKAVVGPLALTVGGGVVSVEIAEELSEQQKALLDAVVAQHAPEQSIPDPPEPPQE